MKCKNSLGLFSMMPRLAAALTIASIFLAVQFAHAVTINVSGAFLTKADGTTQIPAGGTVMLIASRTNTTFGALTNLTGASASSFVNEADDFVVARWASSQGFTQFPVTFNLGDNGVGAGRPLILVWYVGLVESSHPTSPGNGRRFGTYRTDAVLNGSTTGWVVPGDNSATIDLNMLTMSAGGSLPESEGKADQTTQAGSSNQPPVAICRSVTNSVTTNCTVAVTAAQVDNGSFDPNGTIVNRILKPFGPFHVGTTNVTLTVVDNQGASNSCSTTITVLDIAPPTITCPAPQTRTAPTNQCSMVVTYPAPVVHDNCSATASCVPPSGSVFALGVSNVVCTATDAGGNTAQCTFKVTVKQAVKPVVSIVATDATASEPGTDTGKFTVFRTGCTNIALQVFYTVGGTATPGSDYTALVGKLTIPIGKTSGIITVKALDDATPEPVETVIVTVSTNASYNVGSPSTATVNISSNE